MKKQANRPRFFSGIGKMLPFLKPHSRGLLIMVGCSLISTLFDIAMPLFQRYSLNHFIGGSTLDTLPWFILIYILALLLAGVLNYFGCTLATRLEVRIDRDLRNAAFTHLQTLSFSYFNQNSVGYIHARVISDTSRIGTLFSWSLINCSWQISYLIGAVAVMLAVNLRLALMVIVILPLITVLFSVFQGRLVNINRDIREINSNITGSFNEGITGAKTVKALAIEDQMHTDFVAQTQKMRGTSIRSARIRGLFASVMGFASSLALAIVLWQGGILAQNEVGTFSMFMSYAQGMMEPVRWIIDAISQLITTQVNIDRLFGLLETPPDVRDRDDVTERYGDSFNPKKENWEPLKGDIEFRDVTFRYPDGGENVLEHFHLKIPFGTNVAIVGETGAGKSTLINLVCRFFEPTSGTLLIDGTDVRERSQLWLHSSIGYVLQTPHLFSGTVRENLLYGNPNATEQQIREALRLVSADDLVNRLENGLDTDVGEGGDLLSAGEKQLISFARAILADPHILILDEATSSVDTITEQKIQDAIGTVIRGRTSIMVAHRLSTIQNADLILVVQNGKIVEQGSHRDLMQKRGYYYDLFTRQYQDESTSSVLHSL